MKTLLSLSTIIIAFIINLNAQNCAYPTSEEPSEVNKINSIVPMRGLIENANLGRNYTYFNPFTEDYENAEFVGGLWFGGVDENGEIKVAAETYGVASGHGDYWSGPLQQNTGGWVQGLSCSDWDRHFIVTNDDIENLLSDFTDGTIDDDIPINLLRWPGQGNPHFFSQFGFELPPIDLSLIHI